MWAQSATEGHVVAIQGEDIVIDLARPSGIHDGSVVELWRPVTLKHPITGAELTDRFLIGRLRVRQARDAMSLARAEGRLAREAHPGDVTLEVRMGREFDLQLYAHAADGTRSPLSLTPPLSG